MAYVRSPVSSDKQQILAFCQDTFSWGDYIHEVYDFWTHEGVLAILDQDGTPIGMCHGVTYPEEEMLWIEGIRVQLGHRRHGFAEKLVSYLERNVKESGIIHADMLIESENTPSLNLAGKIGYNIKSQWNYFPVTSKKNSIAVTFDTVDFGELKNEELRYVESWRWIPINQYNFEKLESQGNILCVKNNGKIQSLGIISESVSFENTIILTIIFGTRDDIHKMILYAQNLSAEKNYSKVRILTEQDNLPEIDNLGKKFQFYLVEKKL